MIISHKHRIYKGHALFVILLWILNNFFFFMRVKEIISKKLHNIEGKDWQQQK
jgi:hypothetical protein